MPDYRCRLASASGEIIERDYTADDQDSLRRDLEKQDYLVLSIQRRSSMASAASGIFRRKKAIKVKEFLIFNQEFGALLKAGLPIIESISLLLERRKNPVFKAALEDVRDRVKGGEALSDAFAAQGVFPPLFSSTLASGERSGELPTVIGRYVEYTQKVLEVRKKVVAALTYPVILVCFSVLLAGLLLIFVLPRFEDFFSGFNSELPLLTRIVMTISETLRSEGLFILGGVAVLLVLFSVWRRTPAGARAIERLVYRLPVIGSIVKKFVQTRFCRTLGTLVAGGIPVVTSLEVLTRSIGAAVFADATHRVVGQIREGAPLWSSLEKTGLFPDMAIEMIKVGESSGSLPDMLTSVSDFVDQEIDHELQTMVSLFEPVLLVGMAVIVGSMLLAIYLPLLQIYSQATM